MFLQHFTNFQFTKQLKHLIVHVTNHCNYRCKHCFIDFSPKRDLPLEKYQELGRQVGKLFWLDIGGGEPFLRKDLVDICASFKSDVMTIPTNGFFLDRVTQMTRDIQKRIPGELSIALSLDGLEKTHNYMREEGSWDKVWTAFEALKKIPKVRVKINTVLCKENFEEILPLMRLVLAKKPDFHSIILLRGNPMDPKVGLPPLEDLDRVAPEIFEILGQYDYGHKSFKSRILRNYHKYLWNTSMATLRQRTQVIPCLAGLAHAVVMGNGDVSSCEMLPAIGNIKDNDWNTIWKSDLQRRQRDYIAKKKCFCTHNCAMLDSVLLRPASLSQLITGVKLATR